MGTLLVYILKSAVCLIVFYLFYKLLMSKETFHRFNRFALLGILVICSLVPLITADMVKITSDTVTNPDISIDTLAISAGIAEEELKTDTGISADIVKWAIKLYIAGMVFFVIRSLFMFGKIIFLTSKGKRYDIRKYVAGANPNIRLTVTDDNTPPFSWMNHIVISETDLKENGTEILCHEMAHINNMHSVDLLIADLCIILQWFNPAAWLTKAELQNVHEFEADETVIKSGINAKQYQLLLIKKAVGSRLYSIANSFNHSKLKKRITMMMKKSSNPWARVKYLYVLPVAAIAVAAFARPEISKLSDEISSVKVNDFSAIKENHEPKNIKVSDNAENTDEKIIVKGTIVDENTGDPVSGASIIIRGTTNGTISDSDGKFSLEVEENSVILISFIGKQTYSIIASKQDIEKIKNTPIKLKDDVKKTDEIVVVSYADYNTGNDSKTNSKDQKSQNSSKSNNSTDSKGNITDNKDDTFTVVESMPEFPGGINELMRFMSKNIKYPVDAQKAKIEGRVIVQFVVRKDGSTSDFSVMRSVSPSLDAEAIRVLSLMPKWKPGMQRGKAVNVKYTVPITFKLNSPVANTGSGEQNSSNKSDNSNSSDNADKSSTDGNM